MPIYSIQNDIDAKACLAGLLHEQVEASGLSGFGGISAQGDAVRVEFDPEPSGDNRITLDAIVADHDPSVGPTPFYASEEDVLTITATTPQPRVSASWSNLSGPWVVEWYCEVKTARAPVIVIITINGEEAGSPTKSDRAWIDVKGFKRLDLNGENLTATLSFYSSKKNRAVSIRYARLRLVEG